MRFPFNTLRLQRLLRALCRERAAVSAAITAGTVLIFAFHAPIVPVATGCILILAVFAGRSVQLVDRPQSPRFGHTAKGISESGKPVFKHGPHSP